MTLKEGATLQNGKYTIKKVIGQGGFGITYLGEQTSLGRKVAIKEFFMRDLCNRDESTSQVSIGSEGSRQIVSKFREKFVKEARFIASFEHPNIISVIDVFEENGTAYYAMKYCVGDSLAQLLKTQYPSGMPEAMALRYIREVASALDYIHKRSINHLDVKPSNIMLNESGNAVLIDFGLSKQYDAETGQQTSSTPVGISEGYAPMEQYKKGGVGQFSPSTDIYSLGATLYKLITGQTPPDASTINEEGIPPFQTSDTTKKAIFEAMKSRRADRPQSISSWLNLLNKNSAQIREPEEIVFSDKDNKTILISTSQTQPSNSRIFMILAAVIMVVAVLLGIIYLGRKTNQGKIIGYNADTLIIQNDTSLLQVANVPTSSQIEEEVEQPKVTIGKFRGHKWVDLGLPSGTKWADCNIGSSNKYESGDYYAWAETVIKNNYTEKNLRYYLNPKDGYSKYVNDNEHNVKADHKKRLEKMDDAAYVNWGKGWEMPTQEQFEELFKHCKYSKCEMYGQLGFKFVGSNGEWLFFPAAGYKEDDSIQDESDCYYWTRTHRWLIWNDSGDAICFTSNWYSQKKRLETSGEARYYGYNIRAVLSK